MSLPPSPVRGRGGESGGEDGPAGDEGTLSPIPWPSPRDSGDKGHRAAQTPDGSPLSPALWPARARLAREASHAARLRAAATVVEAAAASGARLAKAADRAGPMLDRLDDALVPAAVQGLETVVGAAATTSRVVTTGLLHLAVRARLVPGAPPRRPPQRLDGPSRAAAQATAADDQRADEPSVGRALLERGARIAVLGLVAMIVLSAAAALLPGMDRQPHRTGGLEPASPPGDQASTTVTPSVTIGPSSGMSTDDYVGGADQSLAALAQAAPEADLVAVVSLTGYRTPAGLQALLADYRVTRVFFAVPGSGFVRQAPVRTPVDDVLAGLAAQATASDRQAATATDPAVRASAQAEAAALRQGSSCSCLFGAVVRAPAARLLALRQDRAVRVVDPAPPATLENAVRFIPVTPDHP